MVQWYTFSANLKKWSTHTQAISQLLPTNFLSVFDHFVGLALKGLNIKCHVSLKG